MITAQHRRLAAPAAQRQSTSPALQVLAIAAAVLPLLSLRAESDLPSSDRLAGAVLWILCVAPTLFYAASRPKKRPPIPMFPLLSIVYGLYYALPAMLGAVNLAYKPNQFRIPFLDPKTQFSSAVSLALWGWVMVLLGYMILPVFFRPRVRQEKPWPIARLTRLLVVMIVGGLGMELLLVAGLFPVVLAGPVAFIAALSRFAIATMLALRARHRLSQKEKIVLLIAIPAEIVIRASSGSIASVLLFILFVVLAQYIGGGRIRVWWLVLGIAAALPFIALKGVLEQYRRQAWFTGADLGILGRTALMTQLVSDQVQSEGALPTIENGLTTAVARSATLDLLADIVQRTPRDVPYWGGQTYLSLLGSVVPRFLWPSKPTKTLGQDFGHRYNFLEVSDNYTSINFPFLVEFYANFGVTGILVGMFLTGLIYRALDLLLNIPGQSVVISLASLAIMLPLLNIESDFSLVFGGLFLNIVAFRIVLQFLRRRAQHGLVADTAVDVRTLRPAS